MTEVCEIMLRFRNKAMEDSYQRFRADAVRADTRRMIVLYLACWFAFGLGDLFLPHDLWLSMLSLRLSTVPFMCVAIWVTYLPWFYRVREAGAVVGILLVNGMGGMITWFVGCEVYLAGLGLHVPSLATLDMEWLFFSFWTMLLAMSASVLGLHYRHRWWMVAGLAGEVVLCFLFAGPEVNVLVTTMPVSLMVAILTLFEGYRSEVAHRARFLGDTGLEFGRLSVVLDSRLTPFDRFLVDNVIFAILGQDTNCHVESFDQSGGRAVIRLVASNPDDLFAVADALAERVWEQAPKQLVVNEGDVEQQFNVQGDLINKGVSEAELQAQRESYEALLRQRDDQIVVLQGKLAKAVSDLVDRIDRIVYRPGPDEEGEERTWEMNAGER